MQLTAYHVVHVLLHLIHTLASHALVGTSFYRVKVPWTIGGTAHHYARTFSL